MESSGLFSSASGFRMRNNSLRQVMAKSISLAKQSGTIGSRRAALRRPRFPQDGWSEAIPINYRTKKVMGFASLYPSYAL
jgi:hypothetical protein